MDRIELALRAIDRAGRGLEIGPSYSPLITKASGARVETLDHLPREALVEKYRTVGLTPDLLDRIEEVDHLWSGGSLLDVVPDPGTYDYLLASNFIEHTVDLVGFLQDCEGLLKVGGRLSLVIPDKRFCFDRFRPLSSIGAVLQAEHATNMFHNVTALVDADAYRCWNDGVVAWGPDTPDRLQMSDDVLPLLLAAEGHGLAQDDYVDTHHWVFTPASFELLLADLAMLGRHRFRIVDSHDTYGFEFFVTLEKTEEHAAAAPDRLAFMRRIEAESAVLATSPSDSHLREAELRFQSAAEENRRLQEEVAALRASSSWKLTAPLRGVAKRLKAAVGPSRP